MFCLVSGVASELSILRGHFREHNRSVLFASGATLLFALVGWAVIYGLCYWFTVAFLSVKEGLKFNGTENFNRNFFSSVAVLYVATVIDRWLFRFDREAVDRRPLSETLLDAALFLPRMTLAVLENFGVWIRLSEKEEVLAARLVELIRERGRYAEQEVPLVIASPREQHRIITALRIALVVDVRNEDGIAWLYIGSLAPASLAPELGAGYGYHNIPRVRRRPVLENKNPLPRSQHQLPGGDRNDL